MALTNSPTRYGAVARSLHWLTAALILTLIPLGLYANALASGTDAELARKAAFFSVHKTLGVTVFFVALLRVLWALGQRHPVPLHPDRRLETWAAATVHWALYAAILLVPLSGWLHHAATDGFAPIRWPFGQSLPLVPKSPAVAEFFATCHWLFTKVLIAALILHIAGALKHAVIDRDATLSRMSRGTEAGDPSAAHAARAPLFAAAAIWVLSLGAAAALALPGLIGGAAPGAVGSAEGSEWAVESGTLSIRVRQMGQDVSGSFATWSAAITFDPDAEGPVLGGVDVRVDTASLTLGSVTAQALTSEFLDTAAHPEAVFSAAIHRDGEAYIAEGDLTLKGEKRPATLPFTLALDGDRAHATGQLTLDRRGYNIGPGYKDETSLGFPVEVMVELTATRP